MRVILFSQSPLPPSPAASIFPKQKHLAPIAARINDALITCRCKSRRMVKASYHSDTTADVQYEGKTREMSAAVSGSGARYLGDGLERWTKGRGPGSEGVLFRHGGTMVLSEK